MTFRRIVVFCCFHLTLVCILHPPESRAFEETIDDARPKAIPRLLYPRCLLDARVHATRTHSHQPRIAVCAR